MFLGVVHRSDYDFAKNLHRLIDAVNVAGVGMLQSSKNQKSTLALIDYLLSTAGQEYFAQKSYEYPLVAGIAQYAELPALADLNSPNIDLSDLKSIALTQEMLEEVGLLTK